jgi:hypothetical protein
MHIVDCRTTNHPPLTVLYVLSLPSPNLWEISKNENSKTMRNIQEWEIVIGKVPQTTNYDFQQRLLHNALTTGHYNLWTGGKEWKKKGLLPSALFFTWYVASYAQIVCMIGWLPRWKLNLDSGVHPQLSCKEALPSPTQWVKQQHLHMLKTPICLFGVPWKRYKYHVVWLTQGVWQPNLAYPRLN